MNSTNIFLSGFFSLILIVLQIVFGFMMQKHRKAFLKYHRGLGIVIFFVVLTNVLVLPAVSIIGAVTLVAILGQIVMGFLLIKNKRFKKYHKPLGISIITLVVANLVLALL